MTFRPFDGLDNGRQTEQYQHSVEPQAPYSGRMMNAKAIAHIKSKLSTPSKISNWGSGLTNSSSFGSTYSNSSQKKKAPSHANYSHNAIVGRQTPLHSLNHSRRLAASRRSDVFGMTALNRVTREITTTPNKQSSLSTSALAQVPVVRGNEDVYDAFDDFEAYDENWAELKSSRRRREDTTSESIGYGYPSSSDYYDVAKVSPLWRPCVTIADQTLLSPVSSRIAPFITTLDCTLATTLYIPSTSPFRHQVDRMVSTDTGSAMSRTFSIDSNCRPFAGSDESQAYGQTSVGLAVGDGYQVSRGSQDAVFASNLIGGSYNPMLQTASIPRAASIVVPEVTGIALSGFLAEVTWKLVTEPFAPFEPAGSTSLDSSPSSSGIQTPEVPWPARDPCIQSYSKSVAATCKAPHFANQVCPWEYSLGRDATSSPLADNLHPKYFANLGIHGYEYRESMSPGINERMNGYQTPVKDSLALKYNPYQLSSRVPASFHDFVNKTLSQTLLSPTAIMLSLWYIKRFAIHTGGDDYGAMLRRSLGHISTNPGSSFNGEDAARRILTLGLASANKWLDDNTFTNKSWSDVTGLNNTEINRLEMLALGPLSFDLSISLEDWNVWLQEIHDSVVPCTHDRALARQALSQVWQMLDRSNARFEHEIVNRQGSPVVSAFDSPFSAAGDDFGLVSPVGHAGAGLYGYDSAIASTGYPSFDATREKYMQSLAMHALNYVAVKPQPEPMGYPQSASTFASAYDRAPYAENLYLRSQQLYDAQHQAQVGLPHDADYLNAGDYWTQSEYQGYPYVSYDNHPMALPPIRTLGMAA